MCAALYTPHACTCVCSCRYGFNPGSALGIVGLSDVAALAAINTTLGAATGTLSALVTLVIVNWIKTKHIVWDLIGASNGTLAGLVGITAGCSVAEVRRFACKRNISTACQHCLSCALTRTAIVDVGWRPYCMDPRTRRNLLRYTMPPVSASSRASVLTNLVLVQPWGAICIGLASGILYVFASWLVANVCKIDDPLDAIAVHAFCGCGGVLMASAFSHTPNYEAAYNADNSSDRSAGFLYGGDGHLLAAAVVYCLAIAGWVLGHMVPFFFLMRILGLLRVDESEERAGLDVSHHGGSAYEMGETVGLKEVSKSSRSVGKAVGKAREDESVLSRCALLHLRALRALKSRCCAASCACEAAF